MVNLHVQRYFQQASADVPEQGRFHHVLSVHESDLEWEALCQLAPSLPRGWFELARLPAEDRPEFLRGFWIATLPYVPHIDRRLELFFDSLEDVGIYLTQQTFDSPHLPQMVYSLEDNNGFFHGFPPAAAEELQDLEEDLILKALPGDYLAFLKIHDGFSKVTDTGLIHASVLREAYDSFQSYLSDKPPLRLPSGQTVRGEQLIPFYQSFGLQAFQCFHMDWFPEEEMGCVYYSGIDNTVSDYSKRAFWADNLAFPTFLDWLAFYLETFRI